MERGRPSAEPLLAHDTERRIAETASLGAVILTVLHGQRRALEGAREQQADAVAELEASGSVMQQIMKRVMVRRAIYCAVILALVAAIIWTCWWKMQVHSK